MSVARDTMQFDPRTRRLWYRHPALPASAPLSWVDVDHVIRRHTVHDECVVRWETPPYGLIEISLLALADACRQ